MSPRRKHGGEPKFKFRVATDHCHKEKVDVTPKAKCSGTLYVEGHGGARVCVSGCKGDATLHITTDGTFFTSGPTTITGPTPSYVSLLGVLTNGSPTFPASSSTPQTSQFVLVSRGSYATTTANLSITASIAGIPVPGTTVSVPLVGNGTYEYRAVISAFGAFGQLTFGSATSTTTMNSGAYSYAVTSPVMYGLLATIDAGSITSMGSSFSIV